MTLTCVRDACNAKLCHFQDLLSSYRDACMEAAKHFKKEDERLKMRFCGGCN